VPIIIPFARRPDAGTRFQLTDGEMAKGYFVPPTVFADVKDGRAHRPKPTGTLPSREP
jgi:hypothetical protein